MFGPNESQRTKRGGGKASTNTRRNLARSLSQNCWAKGSQRVRRGIYNHPNPEGVRLVVELDGRQRASMHRVSVRLLVLELFGLVLGGRSHGRRKFVAVVLGSCFGQPP